MVKKCGSCDTFIRLLREVFISFFDTNRDIVKAHIESLPEEELVEFLNGWVRATKGIELPEGEESEPWEKIH